MHDKKITLTEDQAWKYGKRGYQRLRTNARNRGIPFTINNVTELVDWWTKTPDLCHWCRTTNKNFNRIKGGIVSCKSDNPLIQKLKKWLRNYHSKYLTFDRVDSEGAYSIDNLVKACPICNNVKGFLIEEDDMQKLGPKIIIRIMKVLKEECKK